MKWKSRRFKSERQSRKKQTSYFSKDAVLRNIIKNSTAEPDWSRLSDRIGDIEVFELKEVPLASLSLDSEPRDSKRFDYAEMDTEPPPITIDETGAVIDGRHRVYAARDMGKSTIKAYVPTHLTPHQASHSIPNVQFPGSLHASLTDCIAY